MNMMLTKEELEYVAQYCTMNPKKSCTNLFDKLRSKRLVSGSVEQMPSKNHFYEWLKSMGCKIPKLKGFKAQRIATPETSKPILLEVVDKEVCEEPKERLPEVAAGVSSTADLHAEAKERLPEAAMELLYHIEHVYKGQILVGHLKAQMPYAKIMEALNVLMENGIVRKEIGIRGRYSMLLTIEFLKTVYDLDGYVPKARKRKVRAKAASNEEMAKPAVTPPAVTPSVATPPVATQPKYGIIDKKSISGVYKNVAEKLVNETEINFLSIINRKPRIDLTPSQIDRLAQEMVDDGLLTPRDGLYKYTVNKQMVARSLLKKVEYATPAPVPTELVRSFTGFKSLTIRGFIPAGMVIEDRDGDLTIRFRKGGK